VRVWGTAAQPARLPVRTGFTAVALDLDSDASSAAAFAMADRGGRPARSVWQQCRLRELFGGFAGKDFAGWQRQLDAMLVHPRLSHLALPGISPVTAAPWSTSPRWRRVSVPFMSAIYVSIRARGVFGSLMMEVAKTGIIVDRFSAPAIIARVSTRRCRLPQKTSCGPSCLGARSANSGLGPCSKPTSGLRHRPRGRRRISAGSLSATAAVPLRSGTFFQARLGRRCWAPLVPQRLRRAVAGPVFSGCSLTCPRSGYCARPPHGRRSRTAGASLRECVSNLSPRCRCAH